MLPGCFPKGISDMGMKRRLRRQRKKLGGELRKSVDKSVLAEVERGLRPVREQMDLVRNAIEDELRSQLRRSSDKERS